MCVLDSKTVQVRSLERPAPGGAGTKRERGRGDGGDANGGGDPLREAYNRLGSIIDFQAQQQVTGIIIMWFYGQSTTQPPRKKSSVRMVRVLLMFSGLLA